LALINTTTAAAQNVISALSQLISCISFVGPLVGYINRVGELVGAMEQITDGSMENEEKDRESIEVCRIPIEIAVRELQKKH
jgi:hypothetical protein